MQGVLKLKKNNSGAKSLINKATHFPFVKKRGIFGRMNVAIKAYFMCYISLPAVCSWLSLRLFHDALSTV